MDENENIVSRKYFNAKQIEAMKVSALNEYIVASRGFGKSEGIDAPRLVRNVFAMPRSAGAMLSPTYGKLLQNTLPAVANALDRLGYKRNVHYFVGRKAPAKMNFKTPVIEPFDYDHVMSWYNGSILHLVSFDRPMSVNSMSLDYVFGFEAKYLDYDKIKSEVLPANRGNISLFKHCPWHHGQVYSTDMPTTKRGSWILEKKKEMNPELIKHILRLYEYYAKYKAAADKNNPMEYNSIMAGKTLKDLNALRSKATFYAEYNAFDNIEILGDKFIRDMKRDLPPLLFRTSILNERISKIPNGFYSWLDDRHFYPNIYLSNVELAHFDFKSAGASCARDADLIDSMPLEIACDYNAAICNLIVSQLHGNKHRTVNQFFVKTPRKLRDVVTDFCKYYNTRVNRDIIYYYDSTAIPMSASSNETFADEVISVLESFNFRVTPSYIGQPARHALKHLQMDDAGKGDTRYLTPEFNEEKCETLRLAMQQTGIRKGPNGFEKDKTSEKRQDSPEDPDELKPHVTDAWDTLFQGMNFFRPNLISVVGGSVFR